MDTYSIFISQAKCDPDVLSMAAHSKQIDQVAHASAAGRRMKRSRALQMQQPYKVSQSDAGFWRRYTREALYTS